MPIVEVDGVELEFPDSMSNQEIKSVLRQKYPSNQQQITSPQSVAPIQEQPAPVDGVGFGTSIMKGAMDPLAGGAQMLLKALPEPAYDFVGNLSNKLIDLASPGNTLPADPLQQMAQNEASYREKQGEGFDSGRLAGNVLSPVNLALASKIPQAGGLLKQAAIAVPVGAGFGLLTPTEKTGQDFWKEKVQQAAVGGLMGPVSQLMLGSLARTISPKSSPEVQSLIKEGITPTPGQLLGPTAKVVEEKLISAPILGDAIRSAQKRGLNELNRSAMNRVLAPLGKSLPKTVKAGSDGLTYVKMQASKAYDDVLDNTMGIMDDVLVDEIANIRNMANRGLPPQDAKILNNKIQDMVIARFTEEGRATGRTLKDIQNQLRIQANSYVKSPDPYKKDMGNALREVRSSMDKMIKRVNPEKAGELKKVDEAWANYSVLREATTRGTEAEGGLLTPGQLSAGVERAAKQGSRTKFQENKALMQDLSRPGMQVLANRVPNSFTADRGAVLGAIGGGAYFSPEIASIAGLLGVGALPYMPGLNKATASLLAGRQSLKPISNAITGAAPFMLPGAVGAGNLLNQ